MDIASIKAAVDLAKGLLITDDLDIAEPAVLTFARSTRELNRAQQEAITKLTEVIGELVESTRDLRERVGQLEKLRRRRRLPRLVWD
jgi:hypothetical protein